MLFFISTNSSLGHQFYEDVRVIYDVSLLENGISRNDFNGQPCIIWHTCDFSPDSSIRYSENRFLGGAVEKNINYPSADNCNIGGILPD